MTDKSQSSPDWTESLRQQQLSWAVFEFVLQVTEPLYLPPYKGSALRGDFGNSFRKICCVMQQPDCRGCSLIQSCAYSSIFETPQAANLPIDHQAANLPPPFVIAPPDIEKQEFTAGETLKFGLVLVGKSIPYFPYFVLAFDQLGRMGLGRARGRYRLAEVYSFNDLQRQAPVLVYDGGTQVITGNFRIWQLTDLHTLAAQMNPPELQLEFVNTTRIVQQNKVINTLPFDLLIRTLLRRSSLLAQIHGTAAWELPFQEIIDQAKQVPLAAGRFHWLDWERYSNRQQQRMNFGGFVGTVTYLNGFEPFLPLILLGQFLHIGKNTTFGLGKYFVRERLKS